MKVDMVSAMYRVQSVIAIAVFAIMVILFLIKYYRERIKKTALQLNDELFEKVRVAEDVLQLGCSTKLHNKVRDLEQKRTRMYLELQVSVESSSIEYYAGMKNKLIELHGEYDKLIVEILQRCAFEEEAKTNGPVLLNKISNQIRKIENNSKDCPGLSHVKLEHQRLKLVVYSAKEKGETLDWAYLYPLLKQLQWVLHNQLIVEDANVL